MTCVPDDEVCDGADNDCNGEIDDIASHGPLLTIAPVRSTAFPFGTGSAFGVFVGVSSGFGMAYRRVFSDSTMSPTLDILNGTGTFRAAWTGNAFALGWNEGSYGPNIAYGTMPETGAVAMLDEHDTTASYVRNLALGVDGSSVVAYHWRFEGGQEPYELWATRYDDTGVVVEEKDLLARETFALGLLPRVIEAAGHHWVVIVEFDGLQNDVRLHRVDPATLTLVDTLDLPGRDAVVHGSEIVTVGRDGPVPAETEIELRRFMLDGTPIGTPVQLSAGGGGGVGQYGARYPRVSVGGTELLVAWEDDREGTDVYDDRRIWARKTLLDGTPLGQPTTVSPVSDLDLQTIGLAFDGGQWLVTWAQVDPAAALGVVGTFGCFP
jgi:hypothetical protein